MLVVTRRTGDRILIGKDVEVVVTRIMDGQVRIAIQAPPNVPIVRKELLGNDQGKRREARRHHEAGARPDSAPDSHRLQEGAAVVDD